MAMRTRAFLITAVVVATALIPAAGASAGTLDQQQTTPGFGGLQVDNTNSKAQTFTAGLTGQLDQVDLKIYGMSLTTPLTVQIRDGSGTGPGSTILASTTIPTSAAPMSAAFVPATFATPASVTAGTQYAIVAMNDSIGWAWEAGTLPVTSAYVGGKLYGQLSGPPATGTWTEGNPEADFEFKTYVVTPPPGGGGGSTTPAPTTTKKKCKKKKVKKGAAAAKKKKCKKKANKKAA